MPAADTLDDDAPDALVQYCPTCGCSFGARYERCPDDNDRLIPIRSSDPMLGRTLDGRYRISRPLGKGGMGTVYEGVQLSTERPVAIKVITDELGVEFETARRFLREAKMLTALTHPNIVGVFDAGRCDDGTLYLVMELCRGKTLETVLARAKRLPAKRAAEIGIQLCAALAAAHTRGVVHRDLKPANVIIVDELGDLVKVLDFGLAKSFVGDDVGSTSKITQAGMMIGTPLYMAPESIDDDVADDKSDLYALGCMLYELLAGQPPFISAAVHVILARHVHEPPPPLPDDVPEPLVLLIDALLAKKPEDRPASASVVRDILAAFLADSSTLDDDDAPTLVPDRRKSRPSPAPAPAIGQTIRTVPPPPQLPAQPAGQTHILAARGMSPTLKLVLLVFVIAITVFCAVAFLVP